MDAATQGLTICRFLPENRHDYVFADNRDREMGFPDVVNEGIKYFFCG